MPTPLETDADKLIRYQNWESRLLTALEEPETASAFGGTPDANGPVSVDRMGGRAQLLSELQHVQSVIDKLTANADGAFEVTSEMSAGY
jgi:hypothetical protein